MDSLGSITRCLHDLANGTADQKERAARVLWDRYFAELVRHALRRLKARPGARRVADEEDAAIRAFTSVCRGIESGRLQLARRDDLLATLLWKAGHEADNLARRAPGGGPPASGPPPGPGCFDELPDDGPDPALAAMSEEGCRRLLDLLDDAELRKIALWKLLGYTNEEIRARLSCSAAKVERKLDRIRRLWSDGSSDGEVGGPARPGPRPSGGPPAAAPVDPGGGTTILGDLNGRPAGGGE
jgi:DNA-directed RNA polymerase specialized sigma24 family protein